MPQTELSIIKLPRPEAEELAERLYDDLRPRFVELLTDMLAETDPTA